MKDKKKIQVLDTPGTLDRFEKMNHIEKKAELAMKHCANKIVFVFDLTEPYPLKKQMDLYRKIKKYNVPVLVYLSKKDILKDKIKEFKLKHVDVEEI
jgi:GTP1/Obg family GTP-binding protein